MSDSRAHGEPQHPTPRIARTDGGRTDGDIGDGDRAEVEKSGGETEATFARLFDQAPFGYLITDNDDVIVRANTTFATSIGTAVGDLVGRRFRDLLPPGSQLLYETRHLPVLRLNGSVGEVFLEVLNTSGSTLPVLANAATDGVEVRIGVLPAVERVGYEQQLLLTQRTAESLAARVTVLQDASSAFAAAISESAIAVSLVSILEETLTASDACVALVDANGHLDVVAGTNPIDGLIRDDRELLGANVVEFEKPVVVNTADGESSAYPWVVEALRAARLQTIAVFPIMHNAKPVGVVAAFFRRGRVLEESETEVVLALARQAGQVLTRLRVQEQLAFAALHDQLTGLANRASIRHSLTVALPAALRMSRALSVMFLDLDGFKAVNDKLGHHVGDAILQQVAGRLHASVRAGDLVARYGGDEFVVVCAETAGEEVAIVAARIHEQIRAGFTEAEGFPISASIGIAVYTGQTELSTDTIIGTADAAMYESKRLGRDRTTLVEL